MDSHPVTILDAEYFQSVCDRAGLKNEKIVPEDWLRVHIPCKTEDMASDPHWSENIFRNERGIPFSMLLQPNFEAHDYLRAIMPGFDAPLTLGGDELVTLKIDWPGYKPRSVDIEVDTLGKFAADIAREYVKWLEEAPYEQYDGVDQFWKIAERQHSKPVHAFDILKTWDSMRLVALHHHCESHEIRAEVHVVVPDLTWMGGIDIKSCFK